MIDKIIGAFFAVITAILSLFYTPTPVTQVNPTTIPEATKTQEVTIMSYNVWIGGTGEKSPENRTDEIVSKIRKYNPDSFGLQEADEGWMERLPAELIAGSRLETLNKMAKEKGVTASALAVAWMVNLHRCEGFPRVIPLFGSGNVEHFVSNLKGAEIFLTDEELDILNKA